MERPGLRSLTTACLVSAAGFGLAAAGPPQDPPQTQAQQRPVFRAGTHFVRVDAYPAGDDGRILRGLEASDFQLLENGVPQTIDSVQFVDFEPWNPLDQRRDPNTVGDMRRLAADPTYRVFVLYFDSHRVAAGLGHRSDDAAWELGVQTEVAPAVREMLNRMLGPRDLFGILTPTDRPHDLTLGQKPPDLSRALDLMALYRGTVEFDVHEAQLRACGVPRVMRRYRLDRTFSNLEGLILVLNAMREERKNVILFSDGWQLEPADPSIVAERGPSGMPTIGVTRTGTLTTRATQPFEVTSKWCDETVSYLAGIDFERRWRDLTLTARQKNVAFYTVSPGGVWAYDLMSDRTSSILALSSETDGLSVAGTNDIRAGLRKVVEDLSAYYLLGYYTTDTDWDGRPREIRVRLTETGREIRARRQYVAPTEEEIALAAMLADSRPTGPREVSAVELALADLGRLASGAELFVRAVVQDRMYIVVELASGQASVGRWRRGADLTIDVSVPERGSLRRLTAQIEPGSRAVQVVLPAGAADAGPWRVTVSAAAGATTVTERADVTRGAWHESGARLFRATPSPRSPLHPVAEPVFRRTERVRVEWTLPAVPDRLQATLLSAAGEPLDVPVASTSRIDDGRHVLVADASLGSLAAADYVIAATATGSWGTATARQAIRVTR